MVNSSVIADKNKSNSHVSIDYLDSVQPKLRASSVNSVMKRQEKIPIKCSITSHYEDKFNKILKLDNIS